MSGLTAGQLAWGGAKMLGSGAMMGGSLGLKGAKLGGQALISPGIIGSLARWSAASMVLSSLPNPAARKQAIDKALHEAKTEARREYMAAREQFKRDVKTSTIHREADHRERIISAQFMDDPLEKKHMMKMADLTKKRHEVEEKFEGKRIDAAEKADKDWRTLMSGRDRELLENQIEKASNLGRRVGQGFQDFFHGTAKAIDRGTVGVFGLASSAEEYAKKRIKEKHRFVLNNPEGMDLKDFETVSGSNSIKGKMENGKFVIEVKAGSQEEREALMEQAQREHGDQVQRVLTGELRETQEILHKIEEQTRKANEIAVRERQKSMNLQSLGTDYVIQKAQIDAVLNSPFASIEQKMMARIEQHRLDRDFQIRQESEEARMQMRSAGEIQEKQKADRESKLAKAKEEVDTGYDEKYQDNSLSEMRAKLKSDRESELAKAKEKIDGEYDEQLQNDTLSDENREKIELERKQAHTTTKQKINTEYDEKATEMLSHFINEKIKSLEVERESEFAKAKEEIDKKYEEKHQDNSLREFELADKK